MEMQKAKCVNLHLRTAVIFWILCRNHNFLVRLFHSLTSTCLWLKRFISSSLLPHNLKMSVAFVSSKKLRATRSLSSNKSRNHIFLQKNSVNEFVSYTQLINWAFWAAFTPIPFDFVIQFAKLTCTVIIGDCSFHTISIHLFINQNSGKERIAK